MLHYETIGPGASGEYGVAYRTPGCMVPTVVCCGVRTRAAAEAEAGRLNAAQLTREKILQADALARGVRGTWPALVGSMAPRELETQ